MTSGRLGLYLRVAERTSGAMVRRDQASSSAKVGQSAGRKCDSDSERRSVWRRFRARSWYVSTGVSLGPNTVTCPRWNPMNTAVAYTISEPNPSPTIPMADSRGSLSGIFRPPPLPGSVLAKLNGRLPRWRRRDGSTQEGIGPHQAKQRGRGHRGDHRHEHQQREEPSVDDAQVPSDAQDDELGQAARVHEDPEPDRFAQRQALAPRSDDGAEQLARARHQQDQGELPQPLKPEPSDVHSQPGTDEEHGQQDQRHPCQPLPDLLGQPAPGEDGPEQEGAEDLVDADGRGDVGAQ